MYDLIGAGLKNREIGKLLFIEESTVKAHTHHIYDKLGVRSRRALIVQAMLERADSGDVCDGVVFLSAGRDLAALSELAEVRRACESVLLVGTRKDRFERGHDTCVELTFNRLSEPQPRDSARHGITIGPIRGHRVVRVGHGDDARHKRDVLVGASIWVALAVDPLVMVTDDRRDLRVLVDVGEDSLADRRVLLHLASLFEGERARLLQKPRRQPDLADVVNEAAEICLVADVSAGSPMRSAMSRE